MKKYTLSILTFLLLFNLSFAQKSIHWTKEKMLKSAKYYLNKNGYTDVDDYHFYCVDDSTKPVFKDNILQSFYFYKEDNNITYVYLFDIFKKKGRDRVIFVEKYTGKAKPQLDIKIVSYNGVSKVIEKNRKKNLTKIDSNDNNNNLNKEDTTFLLPIKNEKEDWGFINNNGELVIPFKYSSKYQGRQVGFSEGLVPVGYGKPKKYGYINKKGEVVIDFKFISARSFKNGIAMVEVNDSNDNIVTKYINKKGEFVNKPKKDEKKEYKIFQVNDKYGVKDNSGSIIIKPIYNYIGNLDGELISVSSTIVVKDDVNGPQKILVEGFVNKNGVVIIKPQYEEIGDFNDGLAPVRTINGFWGYINKVGKMVIKPQFSKAKSFNDGLAPVRVKNGSWGYINNKGKMVIKPQFSEADSFSEGLAYVEIYTRYSYTQGYIDKTGKIVLKVGNNKNNTGFGKFENGFAPVNKYKVWKHMNYINKKGEFLYKIKRTKSDYIGKWDMDGLVIEFIDIGGDMIGFKCHQGATYLSSNKFKFIFTDGVIMIIGPVISGESFFVITGEGKLVVTDDRFFNKVRTGIANYYIKRY